MEKANKGTGEFIAVAVTRLGSEPVPVKLAKGSTVNDALAAAGITTTARGEYFVDGQRAEGADILEDGDVLTLVTPKQAGSK
jgi:hypothetical protein